MLQIEEKAPQQSPFFQLGFRPFFMVAMGFASLAMILWGALYFTSWSLPNPRYIPTFWHAHEMVFGYGLAVAAGFLLTAIKNWTGIQTLHGKPLLGLLLLWLLARLLPFLLDQNSIIILVIIDLLFGLILTIATALPIIKAKQWHQSAFPSKMALMFISNIVFYLGLLDIWPAGLHYGLYAGFYVLLALIFTMGRRVIPFFIEKGVGVPFQPKNWRWLDLSSLVFFLAFAIADIIDTNSLITLILAALLLVLHSIRLVGWYHPNIWKKSLLWSLYLGYIWIVFGFLLKTLSLFFSISPFLVLHSFSVGGIGLITIGMMSRISLGHTGRNVFDPPKILILVFLLLAISTVTRVLLPLFFSSYYGMWIGLSQILWASSFGILFIAYMPMLLKPRVDGRAG
ncbi:MAG TPA: NnrS family protein [Leucothrix mucor]|nr:NnrS family protein [Leucothrix mucor]